MNRRTPVEALAGTACVCAYLTGMLVGHLSRHRAPIAVLALAVTAIRHRPRRKTAHGRTTA